MPDLTWILSLITPAEQAAVLWLMLTIYAGTEVVKRIVRLTTGNYRSRIAWAAAFGISMFGALALWPRPPASVVPWYIAGVVGGPTMNIAVKLAIAMLDRVSPVLARALTGERRRRDDLPPPGGIERRQENLP